MADYKSYADIYGDVCRAMGDLSQARLDEVKAVINMVYLNEICVCDDLYPLYWLMRLIDDVKTKDEETITGITAASPPVVTVTGTKLADGDIVQITDVVGMTEVNERYFLVDDKGTNSIELQDLTGTDIVGAAYTAYVSGGKVRHRGITLSKKFREIRSFNFRDYSIPLEPISREELESNTSWLDSDSLAKPSRYLYQPYFSAAGAEEGRLLWFTLPDDTYYARIWGEVIPSRLSNTTDVPILPPRFHDAIVSGSVTRLVQHGAVQVENAVIWPGLYKMHLDAIRAENRAYWRKNSPDERSGLYLP